MTSFFRESCNNSAIFSIYGRENQAIKYMYLIITED